MSCDLGQQQSRLIHGRIFNDTCKGCRPFQSGEGRRTLAGSVWLAIDDSGRNSFSHKS